MQTLTTAELKAQITTVYHIANQVIGFDRRETTSIESARREIAATFNDEMNVSFFGEINPDDLQISENDTGKPFRLKVMRGKALLAFMD